jgi:protein involved in polysaccharide export with SLBB domain
MFNSVSCRYPLLMMVLSLGIIMALPFRNLLGVPIAQDNARGNPAGQIPNSQKPFVAGDAVEISVLPDTNSFLNQVFPIDDRGNVDLPIFGGVKIDNMSKADFEQYIKTQYKDYLRFPYVQLKPLMRVSVLGGVPTPGFVYFDPNQSLWELIHQAGGTLDEDGLKEMKWERNRKAVDKNLIPYLQNGTSLRNIGIKSGDQIWVKTPGKPGFWEKAQSYFPIFTFMTGIATFYYTYQILLENRRAGRVR